MNWLKKGPELKLSELKIPDFLYDLFYDLKERHLLPLVALLLVAIVVAPIYAKSSTKSDSEPTNVPPIATGSSVAGGEALVVAKSAPGLRDYRRRLRQNRALDPFGLQRGESGAAGETANGEAPGETAAATVAPAEATVVGEEPSGSSTAAPSEAAGVPAEAGTSGGSTKIRTRYASDSIDVRIVSVQAQSTNRKDKAAKQKPKAQVRRNLPELTMLPARSTPAATFMGTSRDGKKALLLVSSDVESIFGEGTCVIGSQNCQLLALETGLPETFVYGPQERTYRIELLKIERAITAKPRRAALGTKKPKAKPKTGSTGKSGSKEEAPASRG